MISIASLILLLIAVAVVIAGCKPAPEKKPLHVSDRAHSIWCIAVFAAGCALRLVSLADLPAGLSAEEALVGAQAKALWQTGGFLFSGNLTTQFAQWTGESSGPLLAMLTAPFVGVFGMSALTIRLPLALLSCAAMPAVYGLGEALSGKRAARLTLTVVALAPYYVLTARMTCGANAALCLLPIALCLLARGVKKPAAMYIGMAVMGLTAYTQDMFFFISPAMVLAATGVGLAFGTKKRHALLAGALGMALCLPAMMTLHVNLTGGESRMLLGFLEIPALEAFDKANGLYDGMTIHSELFWPTWSKVFAVLVSGVFQSVMHMNIDRAVFSPDGMLALQVISLPLMGLGVVSLLVRRIDGKKTDRRVLPARILIAAGFVITFVMLVLYGDVGVLEVNGTTSLYDYSALFLFDALLMAAGACELERRSRAASRSMWALMAVCTAMLCVHMFGGVYNAEANVYFVGFGEASARAAQLQAQSSAKVNVTNTIYPHNQPRQAAEMMYLCGADADMNALAEGKLPYEIIYAPNVETLNPDEIYMVAASDAYDWDYDAFDYEEYGDFVVLSPTK